MPSNISVLQRLGEPSIVDPLEFEDILQEMRNDFVVRFPDGAGYIDLETEPARKILEVAAYREINVRARANDAARQSNSYWFATGTTLDYHADNYGIERLDGETDERLRQRINLAVNGASKSGTAEYYQLIAMSASVDVSQAFVWRDPLTPIVNVSILSVSGGGLASPSLVSTVKTALNDPYVRMVSDTINVRASVKVTVPVTADVWVYPGTSDEILTRLKEDMLSDWIAESSIGFDLTKAWLISRLMQQGIYRVDITAPTADVVVAQYDAIAIGAVTLNYKGIAY